MVGPPSWKLVSPLHPHCWRQLRSDCSDLCLAMQAWPWDPFSILIESFSHEVGKNVSRAVLGFSHRSHFPAGSCSEILPQAQDRNLFYWRNQNNQTVTHKTPLHSTELLFWVHSFFFFCIHGLRSRKAACNRFPTLLNPKPKDLGIYALEQTNNTSLFLIWPD